MERVWKSRLWRPVAVCIAGGVGILLLSLVCFSFHSGLATAGFSLLILVTLMSVLGDLIESVILSVVAVLCLNYFFVEPLYSLRMTHLVDVIGLAAFLTTSIVIPGLTIRMRRVAAEKLEQTRAELARFARVASLGELTATIAHEVNQPLAGVVSSGNACQHWLASDPPNLERAIQSLERIIRDANRASQVIERVRDLARNSPPKKVPLGINEAVLEIMILLRGESDKQGILLETQLSDDLPSVMADRIQLQQVILNLVNNAIEALTDIVDRPRALFIGTRMNGTNELLLTVRDSGKGMDLQNVHRVFDAFYSTKHEGMGMGLAVCRGIIEAHGGRLWATPNEPQGAVFQFTLPAYRPDAA
jgi:signal transduction histidine kinase